MRTSLSLGWPSCLFKAFSKSFVIFFSHTHVPKDRKSHHGARVPASRPGHIRQPPHKWKPYPLLQQVYSGKLASLHDQSKFQKWKKGIGWRNASNAQETEGDNIATLRLRAIYVCKIATCKNASNQVFKLHVTTGNKTSNWIGLVIQHLDMYVPVRHIFAHWFAYILGQRLAHWPSSRLESFSRKSANPSEVRRTLTQDRLSFIKGMWSTLSMMWNCVDWQFFQKTKVSVIHHWVNFLVRVYQRVQETKNKLTFPSSLQTKIYHYQISRPWHAILQIDSMLFHSFPPLPHGFLKCSTEKPGARNAIFRFKELQHPVLFAAVHCFSESNLQPHTSSFTAQCLEKSPLRWPQVAKICAMEYVG